MSNLLDRLRGGFLGLAIGDTLGSPHEFSYSLPLSSYTGRIQYPLIWRPRFGPIVHSALGQVTDDTTMSIALLTSILTHRDLVPNDVIQSYMNWANSGIKFLGRNTRALFKGVKTIQGYQTRYNKADLSSMQSNGSLMRAFPLILLFIYQPQYAYEKALQDTNLTNPNNVNRDATQIYLTALRYILEGVKASVVVPQLKAQTPEIQTALSDALNGTNRNVTQNKGWVAHALYMAIRAWLMTEQSGQNFNTIIDWVIQQGGDTDTTAAISGSFLGAYYGETVMSQNPITKHNIDMVLNSPSTQGSLAVPVQYHPAHALQMFK